MGFFLLNNSFSFQLVSCLTWPLFYQEIFSFISVPHVRNAPKCVPGAQWKPHKCLLGTQRSWQPHTSTCLFHWSPSSSPSLLPSPVCLNSVSGPLAGSAGGLGAPALLDLAQSQPQVCSPLSPESFLPSSLTWSSSLGQTHCSNSFDCFRQAHNPASLLRRGPGPRLQSPACSERDPCLSLVSYQIHQE